MSDTPVAVTPKPAPIQPAAASHWALFLGLGLVFMLGCRVLLFVWMPERSSDFDNLYAAAAHLLRGENPYPIGGARFPDPLPAVLLAVPFTFIPLTLARPIFDVLVGAAFGYGLCRYRGSYALLALGSGAYLFALANGQSTPLMVSASLIPALGFLLTVRPNTSGALWISRPSWIALLGVAIFVGLSLLVLPSWPRDWWMAWPVDTTPWAPPLLRPLGFLLLLAAFRWRTPEARLLLALAIIPQSALPYELVSLALIPAGLVQMAIFVAGSWVAVGAATDRIALGPFSNGPDTVWLVTLCAVYLPMLWLVLRPTLHVRFMRSGGEKIQTVGRTWKDRRRPHRLPDAELRIEVMPSDTGGVTVQVTHLPTGLFAAESGATRQLAVRKAQDKLAAIVAEVPRRRRTA